MYKGYPNFYEIDGRLWDFSYASEWHDDEDHMTSYSLSEICDFKDPHDYISVGISYDFEAGYCEIDDGDTFTEPPEIKVRRVLSKHNLADWTKEHDIRWALMHAEAQYQRDAEYKEYTRRSLEQLKVKIPIAVQLAEQAYREGLDRARLAAKRTHSKKSEVRKLQATLKHMTDPT